MPRCTISCTSLLFIITGASLTAQPPTDAIFRATTKLVQVSVIAQDRDGKPVEGLRREDFRVLDNGAPQEIRLFLADKPAPAWEVVKPEGVFTNRIAAGAGAGYSVLLFDNLNIDPGADVVPTTARARQKALQALSAIPPGDKIAIYSLWCRFQVVQEFTSDRVSLLQQLAGKFAPSAANCVDSGAPEHRLTERNFNPGFVPPTAAPAGQPAASHADNGAATASIIADIGDAEVKQLAEHLAGIPGRKNLIWLTTTFRLKPSNLQRLINANVAIYPVDTIGSTIGLASEKEAHAAPIRALAAITGGRASVDRDDLDVAIAEALSDGRISYTLGFYPPDEQGGQDAQAAVARAGTAQPKLHQLKIQVIRPGITLRYRTSYTVEPAQPPSADPVADLVQAINRPLDATSIAITASAARNQDRLDLSATFDLPSLDLVLDSGLWKGSAEVVAGFMTAQGVWAGDVLSETLSFNLRPATYASMLQSGATYHKQIKIPAKAVELKLLVGNLASGKIGTLTIPLSEVGPGAAKANGSAAKPRPTLDQLLNDPLDISQVGVAAEVTPDPARPDSFQINVKIDPRDLVLERENGSRSGLVDVSFSVVGSGKVLTKALKVDIPDDQYDDFLENGVQTVESIDTTEGAETLRVVVQDPSSGAAGSVTVPLLRK